jgi:Uma2 family endonuclease
MIHAAVQEDILYPEDDGKPMAENTLQHDWIVKIKSNLDLMYADDPSVFVAGNLLWYPIHGNNIICAAPNAMVAFGRPKGYRSSYKQWLEADIAPQIAFEILSPSNAPKEMLEKMGFYQRYGVDEYYHYDPDENDLKAWFRSDNKLKPVANTQNFISPRLGIRFEISAETLVIYAPDNLPFETLTQERRRVNEERQRANRLAAKLREMGINPDFI